MKVAELRTVIGGYSPDQLRKLVAELYKAMPKKLKEDKQIDELIRDPEALTARRRARSRPQPPPSIDDVRFDVEEFIEYASKQYYFAPNMFVSKRERPKWRFIAKRLHKELIAAAADDDQRAEAAELLQRLFLLLCRACGEYLFSSTDPFRSAGIEQDRFLGDILRLHALGGKNQSFVETSVDLLVKLDSDPETGIERLIEVMAEEFSTPDLNQMAADECTRRAKELRSKAGRQAYARGFSGDYSRRDRMNRLASLSFRCNASLHEWDAAITAHQALRGERGKEVNLYVLLGRLREHDQKALWIREYERAVDAGVKPREALGKVYQGLRDQGVWVSRLVATYD